MNSRYVFRPMGIEAGGIVSVIVRDPATGRLAIGGDIQGFFISQNNGDHWRVRNRGIYVDQWHRVACVLWSETESNTLYAGVGDVGANGGFLASTDGGNNWVRRSDTIQFAGNHAGSPLPSGHPRSTGNLLAQGASVLYAGTYSQGVYSSTDGGFTWNNIGFAGGTHYARSIMLDPNDSDTLYVALYGEKIWRTNNASAPSPSWTQLTNAPDNPEELKFVGTYLYAVCNTAGIFRSTDAGDTWDSLNGAFIDTIQSRWMSIDGYVDGANHVVLVGCSTPIQPVPGGGYRGMVKLTIDSLGSVTYTDIGLDPLTVNLNIMPDNRVWWRNKPTNFKDWPSGKFFTPTYMLIDPTNHNRIWAAGSGGCWRSLDGGANWHLAANGLTIVTSRRLAVDPNNPTRVLVGNTDWTMFEVTDGVGGDISTTTSQAASKAGTGYDICVDPLTDRAYLAVGDRDNNEEGGVFSRAYGTTTWTNENLESEDIVTPLLFDTFTRSVSSGWGTTDTGETWTTVNGPASNLNVNGDAGTLQLAASSASRSAFLGAVNEMDVSGTYDVSWSVAASGTNGHFSSFYVRSDGTTNHGYAFRMDQNPTTGEVSIRFHRVLGTASQIGNTVVVPDAAAATVIHVRYRVIGNGTTTLNMNAWVGGPEDEPDGWMNTMTDTEPTLQAPGQVGFRAGGAGTGYTGAALFSFDNFICNTIEPNPTSPGEKRPLGIAVGRDGSNNRIILAGVQESGIWRKLGSTWSQADAVACSGPQTSRQTWFAWPQGSAMVYVFDRASGVYRSDDYGQNWTLIWATTSDVGRTGYISVNPAVANELWVSQQSGLYRLSNAHTGTVGGGIIPVQITDVARPGAMTITPQGYIYCINLPDSGIDTQLLRSLDNGTTWQDIGDESFKAMNGRPSDLRVTSTGRIYISTLTNGILVGTQIGQQQVS